MLLLSHGGSHGDDEGDDDVHDDDNGDDDDGGGDDAGGDDHDEERMNSFTSIELQSLQSILVSFRL